MEDMRRLKKNTWQKLSYYCNCALSYFTAKIVEAHIKHGQTFTL